jgi:hypothetical protein
VRYLFGRRPLRRATLAASSLLAAAEGRVVLTDKQPFRVRRLLALALAAFAAGGVVSAARASEPQPPVEVSSVEDRVLAARPGDALLLTVGDRITTARVDRAGIVGRNISLHLAGTRLRGQVGGQQVQLDLGGARITGTIGSSEVSLQITRSDGVLKVVGRFGARAISEELSPGGVTAEIGPCRYALKFQHDEYAGQVGCGGQPVAVHLRVPAALVARGDVEFAGLFTALLAR